MFVRVSASGAAAYHPSHSQPRALRHTAYCPPLITPAVQRVGARTRPSTSRLAAAWPRRVSFRTACRVPARRTHTVATRARGGGLGGARSLFTSAGDLTPPARAQRRCMPNSHPPPPPRAQRRCMPNSNGPSAEARRTAMLKRQRRAGTVLDGAAARAASAKKAKFRGSTPPNDVGRQRQPYFHAGPVPPLPPALPGPFEARVAGTGDEAAAMAQRVRLHPGDGASGACRLVARP